MWNWKRDPIDEELQDHFEQLRQQRIDAGDSPEQAARFARHRLGHAPAIHEEVRSLSMWHQLETIVRHLRFAMRSYGRHGGAYVLATGILAAGIALSVALFSLADAVVFAPLPFPDQDRVHLLWKTDPATQAHLVGELAYPELVDLQTNIPEAEYVALFPAAPYGNGRVLQVAAADPVQIESCPSTADFFKALGVRPAMGRDFVASDSAAGAPLVVILSDWVWRTHFGGRGNVLGESVRLNGRGHTVIGVMPPQFDFPRDVGLWVPLPAANRRGMTWLMAVVRTRPNVPSERLLAASDRAFRLQVSEFPKQYSPTQRAAVAPIADYLTGTSKPQLLLSLAAAALLLLSACVSAGNLFLSRALGRRQEIATRSALGATRGQLTGQFVLEALLAASIATAAGSVMASLLIRLLVRWAPADIPRIADAGINVTALTIAALMALAATVACAIGPSILLRRGNLDGLMRGGGPRMAGSRAGAHLQRAFVLLQTTCTVVILIAGALLFVSYRALLRTDLGMGNRDALTINLALRGPEITPEKYRRLYLELLDRLRAAPAITHAAGVLLRPLEGPIGWDTEYTFEFENGQTDPLKKPKANFEVVTTGYFNAVGTPLLAGRDFNDHDAKDTQRVLIVSESVAKRFRAAGLNPIGQRMGVFNELRTVIGVAADARYRGVRQPGHDVYVPNRQIDIPTNYLIVRGTVSNAEMLALVRRILRELDAGQATANEATLGELIDRNTARDRFNLALLMLFACGAIVLAAAGIHSATKESVTARSKEIAVRLALGAERGPLAAAAASNLLPYVAAGIVAGGAAAVGLAVSAESLLFGVAPGEPWILAGVGVSVLLVAAVSAFVPAWNAAGRDPRGALLSE